MSFYFYFYLFIIYLFITHQHKSQWITSCCFQTTSASRSCFANCRISAKKRSITSIRHRDDDDKDESFIKLNFLHFEQFHTSTVCNCIHSSQQCRRLCHLPQTETSITISCDCFEHFVLEQLSFLIHRICQHRGEADGIKSNGQSLEPSALDRLGDLPIFAFWRVLFFDFDSDWDANCTECSAIWLKLSIRV